MSLYYRNLKKYGMIMIIVAIGNLIYELLIRQYLVETNSPYITSIPYPWGIWVKNLIGVATGLVALFFYRKKRHYTNGVYILSFLCVAEVAVIIMSMKGSIGKRTNGLFDITVLLMVLLTYTLSQTDRDLKRWVGVQSRTSSTLDIRLKCPEDFFDSIQVAPKMAMNKEYAAVINRYISSMRNLSPLQINLLCTGQVSDSLKDMMRDVLKMHYEAEEDRVVKKLEKKYRQIMVLIALSISIIGIVRQTSILSDGTIVLEIIGNFAAFGLWQIGYTHFERSEAYDELLLIHIAKYASLNFIER